jgi:YD repeat-containing protein
MKDYVIGIIIGAGVALTVMAPARCEAQTTYLYGPQGQSLGTVQQSGNTQYFYGPQGQSQGTAMRSGNTTYVYGPQGQSVGTVMSPVAPMVIPSYNTPAPSLTPMYDSIFGR